MISIGTAGWSYADWEGRVYPKPKPKGFHALPYLAKFLEVMELNSSFYAYPRSDHAQRWVELLEDVDTARFIFTAKIHRDFTHEAPTASWDENAKAFHEGLAPLAESGRLRCLLAQFPISFARTPKNRKHLARLADLFGGSVGCDLVLELRHRSWFEPDVLDRFRERKLSLAWIDLPSATEHLPQEFEPTGALGYYRLHGRNAKHWFSRSAGRDERYDYLYGQEEIERLAARARRLEEKTSATLVVTNNHFAGQAVANALELRAILTGEKVPAPESLIGLYPDLRKRTRPLPGQGPGLFDAS